MNLEQMRVLWIAGRRGEILLLGPVFQRLARAVGIKPTQWFLGTGEDGTAAFQALDLIGLRPDEVGALCHPADQPAVRMTVMLERIETFMRQRKGQRLIFTGYGPTAAAAALCCHARGNPGLWLKPADPAGLIPRLRWEAGLARVIEACVPAVSVVDLEPAPDWTKLAGVAGGEKYELEKEIPGLRPGAPRIVWAVLRRDWGMFGDTAAKLARALGKAAGERPEIDFVVLSNLNATLERPIASLEKRPENLIVTPPLPYPVYTDLMRGSAGVTTDSALVADEAMALGRPVAALGETAGGMNAEKVRSFVSGDFGGEKWTDWVDECARNKKELAMPADPEQWIDRVQAGVVNWFKGSSVSDG
ncbi:UDP-N-acetylglucosamine 2-epimerase [bacterium]|nr:UDP-N-acetylglucosamine 2-epimerase [bacterium]